MNRHLLSVAVILHALIPLAGASADTIPSLPFPEFAGMAVREEASFDPATGDYGIAGRVAAVQFPGEVLSTDDPVVTHESLLNVSATFTGEDVHDPDGVFLDYTAELVIDGELAFRERSDRLAPFDAATTDGLEILIWRGETTSVFTDPSVIDSPFLDLYFNMPARFTFYVCVVEITLGASKNKFQLSPDPCQFRRWGHRGLMV